MCLAFLILLLSKAISFHGLKLFFSTHELTIHRILTPHKVYERLHTVYSRGWIYEPCDEGETRTERDNLYKEKKKRVEPVELHGIFAILPIPRACPSPVAYMTGDMCEGSSLVRKNSYGGPFVHYLGTQFVGQRQVMGLAVHFPEWAQGPIRRSPSPWLPRTNFLGENVYRMPPCKEIEVTKD